MDTELFTIVATVASIIPFLIRILSNDKPDIAVVTQVSQLEVMKEQINFQQKLVNKIENCNYCGRIYEGFENCRGCGAPK